MSQLAAAPMLTSGDVTFYRVEVPAALEDPVYEFVGSWQEHRSGPGELVESLFMDSAKRRAFGMSGPTFWWSGWRITGTAPELTIDLDEFDKASTRVTKHFLGTVRVGRDVITKGVLGFEFASVLRRRQALVRRLKASRRYPLGIGGHNSGRRIGG